MAPPSNSFYSGAVRFDRYDRIVEHYAAMWPLLVPGYAPILSALRAIVEVREAAPKDVLDIGCGIGSATTAVAPALDAAAQVSLVDGAPRMLDLARSTLDSRVLLAVSDDFTKPGILEQIAPPEAFDLVIMSFALHHLDDDAKRMTIEGAARTLRPGGMLLLADEVSTDRPAGWDMVERVRGRMLAEHLGAGRIPSDFWELETTIPEELVLPFRPSRVDDLTSWLARAGLGVSCPVTLYGSALLVGIRPTE
ncbi:MAG: class I SAM-dependent methyltransferase [Myxococcota bacterium]